jgi:very-short-patch-repair endonuclease
MLKVNKPVFNFYFGASMDLIAKARVLRKNMTPAESVLWNHLRRKALDGYRFRRQHPAGRFILDFYCHPLRLAIELDGSVHHLPEQAEYDVGRTAELERLGITVLRFRNEEILQNIDFVIDTIQSIALSLESIATPPETP